MKVTNETFKILFEQILKNKQFTTTEMYGEIQIKEINNFIGEITFDKFGNVFYKREYFNGEIEHIKLDITNVNL